MRLPWRTKVGQIKDFAGVAWLAPLCVAALMGCSAEKRAIGPSPPASRPVGKADPRIHTYKDNVFQVSEGSRMFTWNGCDSCHTETAPGAARLTDHLWRYGGNTAQIYASIADGRPGGMPAYGAKIASEQIWQIAAFVGKQPSTPPSQRGREASAQQGEPRGPIWKGPIP
jgi:cytochrome c oxidase cbb3-type subunit 3